MNDAALEVAIRAARRAASVILDAAHDLARLPAHRDRNDLAAQADGEAEDAIVATLRAAFPDQAVLGEESGHIPGAREGRGYKWLIDAIDGIQNFARGYPGYAIAIALARGNDVTHAVVLDPVTDELFTARAGTGAQCNDVAIDVSACVSLEHCLLATVLPSRTSGELPAHLRLFSALAPRFGGVRPLASRNLNLAWLAAGRVDAFFATGFAGWDVAAGTLIASEAGARVGDFAGQAQWLASTELVAATPVLFDPLREAIAAARRPAIRD